MVIIYDISRLARDIEAHKKLRVAIGAVGATLESPSIEFGEDSDSQLVENLLASVSQHQRQKNAEQVKNRMRARALEGYWVFPAPAGYRFEKVPGHGRMLVRDEPVASILAEALEGYASGRFASTTEVKRFLDAKPDWPKTLSGQVLLQSLHYIFRRPTAAGFIDIPDWGIHLHPAKHEPLISFETWQRVQARLEDIAHAPQRKDINQDFPLRGLIACACCGNKMTAAWSKGRSRRYPYYVCQTKGCAMRNKSIRKEAAERAFESLLRQLRPMPALANLTLAMLRDIWEDRLAKAKGDERTIAREIKATDQKITALVERILATDSPNLITAYEGQLRKLEESRAALTDKQARASQPTTSLEAISRTALDFLLNHWKLWASGNFDHQRTVIRLAFTGPLPYCRETGYRTANLATPFRHISARSDGCERMVGGTGLEPVTPAM
ncbi:MAG: recombinase family protein [Pseudomonadota bacterium]